MAFTEFCCRSGGSNMNGGALASGAEPATSPVYSATNGGWNSATGVYTPPSGDPSASVTVGDFAHVFPDGATTPTFVGRVTAVDSTTVTVSTTAKGGTAPTTAGSGISINVGGAWAGPSGSVAFPFNFATGPMGVVATAPCRVNLKNDQTYNITAGINHSLIGPVIFQGYTATFGDLGKATIDGGTSGASYILCQLSGSGIDRTAFFDLIFQNNGATGSQPGLSNVGDSRVTVARVVVNNVRGTGIAGCGITVECESYACNQSNTANNGGFSLGGFSRMIRCIAHHNTGSNSNGFYDQGGSGILIGCVSHGNGLHGLMLNNVWRGTAIGCDFYNNAGSGIHFQTSTLSLYVENCNFLANGVYGINVSSGSAAVGMIANCGFGSGTAANTSGDLNGADNYFQFGNVTYGTDLTPWVDPANGDFRIDLAAAKNAGRGAFQQTAAGYAGTIAYPDIGAAQHQDAGGGGGGGLLVNPGMRGGMI